MTKPLSRFTLATTLVFAAVVAFTFASVIIAHPAGAATQTTTTLSPQQQAAQDRAAAEKLAQQAAEKFAQQAIDIAGSTNATGGSSDIPSADNNAIKGGVANGKKMCTEVLMNGKTHTVCIDEKGNIVTRTKHTSSSHTVIYFAGGAVLLVVLGGGFFLLRRRAQ